jgi:hypothetical protein
VSHWYYFLIPLFFLAACAGPTPPLVVKQFKMLDYNIDASPDPMVRGEKQRRLFGAVTAAERRERLGAYYTILWSDPQAVGKGEIEIVFEYQQGATASKVKRLSQRFQPTESSGKVEFFIIGSDYFKNGRVLAWKTTLSRGGRVIATEKSHLWE